MVFSSPIFLFFFLPITLLLGYLTRNSKYRNGVLVILSVIFYVFGEGELIILMFGSITLNFFLGKWIDRSKSKASITVGIIINLVLLIIFKYGSFIVTNINLLLQDFHLQTIPEVNIKLPAGISFYTFHSISYLIDVYRKDNKVQKSFTDMALYICLFPQLIAGPIIRYKDIAWQFSKRVFKSYQFKTGVQRFIIGLGKKVIIANSLGFTNDLIFSLDSSQLSTPLAWFATISYSLQLYFDFSGYSDMAIGLGKMLGFDFLENFNFPFVAKSVREFWQRWHISLSNWFRDYVYIPLGGNRGSKVRVYLNLLTVFFLTGLWHGASWNFVIWGLMHGAFLIIERLGFSKILVKLGPLQHVYMMVALFITWPFFRLESFQSAVDYVQSMFAVSNHPVFTLGMYLNLENTIAFILGIILSIDGVNYLLRKSAAHLIKTGSYSVIAVKESFRTVSSAALMIIFIYSILNVVSGTYNPFIYFRF